MKKLFSLLCIVCAYMCVSITYAVVVDVSSQQRSDMNINQKTCDEVVGFAIYAGNYGLVTDKFNNTSNIDLYLLKYKWTVQNSNNYILINPTQTHGSMPGTTLQGIAVWNYPVLGTYQHNNGKNGFKIGGNTTVRHLTIGQELIAGGDAASYVYGVRTILNPITFFNPTFTFNNANYRNDGSHPSSPTNLTTNSSIYDAQIRFATLYDADGNINTTQGNTAIVECANVVVRRCGDGKIGIEDINGNILSAKGEQCDEGSLNGQPGHCTSTCQNPQSDIQVNKDVSSSTVNPDGSVTWTITVKNLGPSTASNVKINDDIPAGLTIQGTPTASQGTYNTSNGEWTIGTLTPNQQVTLSITTKVGSNACNGVIINTASLMTSTPTDTTTSNNQDSAQTSCNPQSDIQVNKDVSSSTVNPDGSVTWTITVKNLGPSTASNVKINDDIPAGLTIQGTPTASQGTYNTSNGEWTIGTLTPNQQVTLSITTKVGSNACNGVIINTASLMTSTPTDTTTSNNQDSAQTSCNPQSDIQVNKDVSSSTVNPDGSVTWTITVKNLGPSTASNVKINDDIPAGLTIQGTPTASQGTYNTSNGEWTIGTLTPNQQVTLSITTKVGSNACNGVIINTASLMTSTPTDTTTSNNQDSAQTSCNPQSDIQVNKDVSSSTVNPDGSVTWTITVKNLGPSTASNVKINDDIPAGLTIQGTPTASQGTYNTSNGEWTIGTLTPNQQVTLSITTKVGSNACNGVIINTASLMTSTPTDTTTSNNQDSAQTSCNPQSDIQVNKDVSSSTVNPDGSVTWTITVKNLGPSTASNVKINDDIPAGLTIQGTPTASQGTYNTSNGEWTIGTLTPNQQVTLSITTKVGSNACNGVIINTASLMTSTPTDSNTSNNQDSAQTSCKNRFDLSLDKDFLGSGSAFVVGQEIGFKITVTNSGNIPVNNFTVKDYLPTDLTFVSASHNAIHVSGTVTWTVSLAPNTSTTLYVTGLATANPGSHINSAEICNYTGMSNSGDIDSNPCNGVNANEDDDDMVTFTCGPAPTIDLSLQKVSLASTVNVGSHVTFRLDITNSGTVSANQFTLKDYLPAGLTYVSGSHNASHANGVVTRSIASLQPGQTLTRYVTASMATSGQKINFAQLCEYEEQGEAQDLDSNPDCNNLTPGEDDEATGFVYGTQPVIIDLSLDKQILNYKSKYNVGDLIGFKISVTNSGSGSPTKPFDIKDQLPSNIDFVSASDGGILSGNQVIWAWKMVLPKNTETFYMTGMIKTPGTGINKAQVCDYNTGNGLPDPDSDGNCSNRIIDQDDEDGVEFFAVQNRFDLSLDKDFLGSGSAFVVGQEIGFKITVTNSGNIPVNNFTVKDYLPTDLTFVSASHNAIHVSGTVTWTVSLAPNTSTTLYVTGLATANPGSHINSAEICNYTGMSNSGDIDSNPCNGVNANEDDDDMVTFTCGPAPTIDVSLQKQLLSNQTSYTVGQNVGFSITVSNTGNTAINSVQVKDYFSGLNFVSASHSGTYNNGIVTRVLTIPAKGHITVYVTGSVSQAQQICSNRAEVCNYMGYLSQAYPKDPDSAACNGFAVQEDDADTVQFACTPAPRFDLSLDKDFLGSGSAFVVGQEIGFKITVTNSGNIPVNNFTVKDYLPTDLTFVSASHNAIHVSGTVTWTVSLAPNTSTTLYVTGLATANPGSHINSAEICNYTGMSNSGDIDSNPCNGVNANEDDDDMVTFTCGPAPTIDVSLQKQLLSNQTSYTVGQNVGFSITVSNTGNTAINSVQVKDYFSGLNFVSASHSGTYNNGIVTRVLTIPAKGHITVYVTGSVSQAQQICSNRAEVCNYMGYLSQAYPKDPDSAACNGFAVQEDDADTVQFACTPAPRFDLSLDKDFLGSGSAFVVGQEIGFKITVTNSGNIPVNNFTVKDYLPTDLTFVSVSHNAIHVSGTVTWTVSLAPNTSTTLYVTGLATANPGSHINSAEICNYTGMSNSGDIDSNPCNGVNANEDDDDMVTFTCGPAPTIDVSLQKQLLSNQTSYTVGQNVGFSITVSNTGNTAINSVQVKDYFSGLNFVSASHSGTYNNGIVTRVLTIPAKGHITVYVTGSVSQAQQICSNRAEVCNYMGYLSQAYPKDPDSAACNGFAVQEDDADTVQFACTPAPRFDLSLDKDFLGSGSAFVVGQEIGFKITVTNSGNIPVNNFTVKDYLPTDLTFVSASHNAIHVSGTVTWTVSLAPNTSTTLYVTGLATANPGSHINSAEICNYTGMSNSGDIDSNPCNGVNANEDDDDMVTFTCGPQLLPDIAVQKTSDKSQYMRGEYVTYTITYTNIGSGVASGFTVSDTLPKGISYVSANPAPSLGFVNATSGINTSQIQRTINSALLPGQSASVVLTGKISMTDISDSILKNIVCVSGVAMENNLKNNCDDAVVQVQQVSCNSLRFGQNTGSSVFTTSYTCEGTNATTGYVLFYKDDVLYTGRSGLTGTITLPVAGKYVAKCYVDNDINYYCAKGDKLSYTSFTGSSSPVLSSTGSSPLSQTAKAIQAKIDSLQSQLTSPTLTQVQKDRIQIAIDKYALQLPQALQQDLTSIHTLSIIPPQDSLVCHKVYTGCMQYITVTDTVLPVDLAITKQVSKYQHVPNEQVHYTVVVTNVGSGIARGMTIVDTLPVGLSYISSNPSAIASGQYVTRSLGDTTLRPGEQFTGTLIAQLTGTISVTSSYTNTVTVQTSGDTNLSNNTASTGIIVMINPGGGGGGGGAYIPLCGNGRVDPAVGEQCDPTAPSASGSTQACTSDCKFNKLVVCGNNIQEVGEYCDMGQNGGVITVGSNAGKTCTQSCTLADMSFTGDLPKCSQIDPPSIQEGEYLPIRWNLDQSSTNTNMTTTCNASTVGKINSDPNTLKCNLEIYNSKNGVTSTPVAKFQVDCLKNTLPGVRLFETFAKEISSSDGSTSYLFTTDKVAGIYGEYKIVLKSIDAQECRAVAGSAGTGVTYQFQNRNSYNRICAFNFAVTKPYMMIKGSVNGLGSSLGKFDQFYGFGQSNELFQQLQAKTVAQTIHNLSQSQYDALFDKYIKLAVTYVPGNDSPFEGHNALGAIYKVPGKHIYVLEAGSSDGYLTIQQTKDIGVPYTIIVKKGHLFIKNGLKGKGMYVNMEGNIYFNTHDSKSNNRCPTQVVNGIFVVTQGVFDTQNLEYSDKSASMRNDKTEKRRCQEGNLIVNGVLIGNGIDNLITKRRSHLNDWFNASVKKPSDREDLIYKGASLLIQSNPSLWNMMPPVADELTNQLNIHKK